MSEINEYKYKVTMTCSGCSNAVNRVLSRTEGVIQFDISLESQLVNVKTKTLSKDQVFEILKKTGKAQNLDRILGFHVLSNSQLDLHPTKPILAYIAGASVVFFHLLEFSQSFLLPKQAKNSRHAQPLSCLCFSRNGHWLAVGETGHKPRIILWDIVQHKIHVELSGHRFGIEALAFSFDGRYLVSIGNVFDATMVVWDLESSTQVKSVKLTKKISWIEWGINSHSFVTVGERHVKFWSMSEDDKLIGLPANLNEFKDSHFVQFCYYKSVESTTLYALTLSGMLTVFTPDRFLDRWIDLKVTHGRCIAVTKDYIFCGCSDGIIRVFQSETLDYQTTLPKPLAMNQLGKLPVEESTIEPNLYPDICGIRFHEKTSTLCVFYSDHSLYLWDLMDLKNIKLAYSTAFHADSIWGIHAMDPIMNSFQKDSIITCSGDGTVRFWGLHDDMPNCIKVIHIEKDAMKQIKQKQQSLESNSFESSPCGIHAVAIQLDELMMACGDFKGNIRLYDLETFKELSCIEAHDGQIQSLDFSDKISHGTSPTSTKYFLASASRDRLIHIFNLVDKQLHLIQTLDEHSSNVLCVKFCENGHKLVSCGADKALYFYEWKYDTMYAIYHSIPGKSTLFDLVIHHEKKELIAASQDKRILFYSLENGKLLETLKPDPIKDPFFESGSFVRLALNSKIHILAIACSDKSILLYHLQSKKWLTRIVAHSEMITGLCFSHGTLISTDAGGLIFIWNLTIQKELRRSASDTFKHFELDERALTLWARTPSKSDIPPFKKSSDIVPKGQWAQRVTKDGIRLFSQGNDTAKFNENQNSMELSVEAFDEISRLNSPIQTPDELIEPKVVVSNRKTSTLAYIKSMEALNQEHQESAHENMSRDKTILDYFLKPLDLPSTVQKNSNRASISSMHKARGHEQVQDTSQVLCVDLKSLDEDVISAVGIVMKDVMKDGEKSQQTSNLPSKSIPLEHFGEVEDDEEESEELKGKMNELKQLHNELESLRNQSQLDDQQQSRFNQLKRFFIDLQRFGSS